MMDKYLGISERKEDVDECLDDEMENEILKMFSSGFSIKKKKIY